MRSLDCLCNPSSTLIHLIGSRWGNGGNSLGLNICHNEQFCFTHQDTDPAPTPWCSSASQIVTKSVRCGTGPLLLNWSHLLCLNYLRPTWWGAMCTSEEACSPGWGQTASKVLVVFETNMSPLPYIPDLGKGQKLTYPRIAKIWQRQCWGIRMLTGIQTFTTGRMGAHGWALPKPGMTPAYLAWGQK